MYLEYDTSVVSVTSVVNNPKIPDTYGVSDTTDDGCLDLVSAGPPVSLTGDITLVTITMDAVGAPCDQCILNLTVNGLKYLNKDPITAFTDSDGTFTIKCVSPTETSTEEPTEIPEFPIILIPVTAIIGLMFLLSRRK